MNTLSDTFAHDLTDDELGALEKAYPRPVIRDLIQRYEIPQDKRRLFEATLYKAYSQTAVSEWVKDAAGKMAPKQAAVDLYNALTSAKRLLRRNDVAERLEPSGIKIVALSPDYKGPLRRTPRHELMVQIEQFLPTVKAAVEYDARGRAEKRFIREAAKILHVFWVECLGRAPSIQNRGGRKTKALQFLLDCLRVIEPNVKEASFRSLTLKVDAPRQGGGGSTIHDAGIPTH